MNKLSLNQNYLRLSITNGEEIQSREIYFMSNIYKDCSLESSHEVIAYMWRDVSRTMDCWNAYNKISQGEL